MRIISGCARGRKFAVPNTNDVRPTADRVREALFSHLGFRVPGSNVLDLFAGSGALGLEALSRGANSAVFVEQSKQVFSFLKNNVDSLGFGDRSVCWCANGISWLNKVSAGEHLFDLIFLDPPYDSTLIREALEGIAAVRCLSPDGLIVAEHRKKVTLDTHQLPQTFRIVRSKPYGISAITTIEWSASQFESAGVVQSG